MKFKKQISFPIGIDKKIGRYRIRTYIRINKWIEIYDDKNYIWRTCYNTDYWARRKLYKIIKELRRKRDEEDMEELWKPLEGKRFDELPKKRKIYTKKEIRKMYRDAFMEGLREGFNEGFNEDIRMWQAIALVLLSMLIVYLSLNI